MGSNREANRRWMAKRLGHMQLPKKHAPFDFAALVKAIPTERPEYLHPGQPTVAWENAQIGVDRYSRRRFEREGMTPYAADRYATRMGLHPSEVWGEQWWQDAAQFAITEEAIA